MTNRTRLISMLCFSAMIIFVLACGERKKDNSKAVDDFKETKADINDDSAVYIEADSWRSWTPPKTLSGYSLVRFVTDPFKLNGLYSASARYEMGDQWMNVQIVDGSSEQGKREIRDHLEIADMDRDYSSDYGYEKTLERNGIKAKEDYLSPPADQYLIKFMVKDQYGISVKSNSESSEALWGLIDAIDFTQLEGS